MITYQEIHDELDNFNFKEGKEGLFCVFCSSPFYNGKEGIIHKDDCIILRLRERLKNED